MTGLGEKCDAVGERGEKEVGLGQPVGWSKAQRAHQIIVILSWARRFRSFAPTYGRDALAK